MTPTDAPAKSAINEVKPGSAYSWFVVAVLSFAGVVAFIDRQIINLLVEPIKADLGVTDTQISLLQGIAFSLFYAVMALPLARLSDSGNRKQIIIAGAICWTIATFSCGLAGGLVVLFVSRMMVGVGEATLTPGGFSIISDYFERDQLSRALSVFTSSSFLGSGLAFILGGAMIGLFTSWGPIHAPIVGEVKPWQLTFMAVALPGVLVVLLMMIIKEPPRQERAVAAPVEDAPSFREMLAYVRANARVYAAIILGFTFLASAQFGVSAWTPSFFIRTYGWTPAEVGAAFGPLVTVAGVAGVVSGGWINDFLLKRGVVDANLRMPMYAAILSAPFVVAFPLVGDPLLSLACLVPVLFFGTMPFGAGPATLPMITPNRMRAQLVAIYLLVANMVGYALGPTLIALATDYVLGDANLLLYSLSIAPAAILTLGVVVLALGLAPFRTLLKERNLS